MKKVKKSPTKEPVITDVIEEYFMKDGIEWVRKTYMNGKKEIDVKEEINR